MIGHVVGEVVTFVKVVQVTCPQGLASHDVPCVPLAVLILPGINVDRRRMKHNIPTGVNRHRQLATFAGATTQLDPAGIYFLNYLRLYSRQLAQIVLRRQILDHRFLFLSVQKPGGPLRARRLHQDVRLPRTAGHL